MIDSIATFLNGALAGMVATGAGFAGSLILLWTSWRSVKVRRAVLDMELIESDDATITEAAMILVRKLNRDQAKMIRDERFYYQIGVALLAVGFALSFLRELVRPIVPA